MYHDDYHDALEKLIEKKVAHGGEAAPASQTARKATNVIDLVSVLQQSIKEAQGKASSKNPAKPRKKAA